MQRGLLIGVRHTLSLSSHRSPLMERISWPKRWTSNENARRNVERFHGLPLAPSWSKWAALPENDEAVWIQSPSIFYVRLTLTVPQ